MREMAQFKRDALWTYERSRLQAATRVTLAIAPLTILCMWETGAPERSVGVATTLLVVAIAIRWRQRNGFMVTSVGLLGGVVPMAAALALCRFAPWCPPETALALCGGAGLVSGWLIGLAMSRMEKVHWSQWLSAAVVAGLTATLGCMALGLGTAVGAAGGVALGAAAVAGMPRRGWRR